LIVKILSKISAILDGISKTFIFTMLTHTREELLSSLTAAVRSQGQGSLTTAQDLRDFLTLLVDELLNRTAGNSPTPTESIITGSKLDLSLKHYRDLTSGTNSLGRFYQGVDALGWDTGGNTGTLNRMLPRDKDGYVEFTYLGDDEGNQQKACLGIIPNLTQEYPGWSGGTLAVAVTEDDFITTNVTGTASVSATKLLPGPTSKLMLEVMGSVIKLKKSTNGIDYTTVLTFPYQRTTDLYFFIACDGLRKIYNLQGVNLLLF
jgi:hypothetical protein